MYDSDNDSGESIRQYTPSSTRASSPTAADAERQSQREEFCSPPSRNAGAQDSHQDATHDKSRIAVPTDNEKQYTSAGITCNPERNGQVLQYMEESCQPRDKTSSKAVNPKILGANVFYFPSRPASMADTLINEADEVTEYPLSMALDKKADFGSEYREPASDYQTTPHSSGSTCFGEDAESGTTAPKEFSETVAVNSRKVQCGELPEVIKGVWNLKLSDHHVFGEKGKNLQYEGSICLANSASIDVVGKVSFDCRFIMSNSARCWVDGEATFPNGIVLHNFARVDVDGTIFVSHRCDLHNSAVIDLYYSAGSLFLTKPQLMNSAKIFVKKGRDPFTLHYARYGRADVDFID